MMAHMSAKKESKRKDDILSKARAQFTEAKDAWADHMQKATEDYEFRAGDQWNAEDVMQRDLDRRPTLTINRLPQFIRQVCNDQKRSRPSIQLNPLDADASFEVAMVLQRAINQVEARSSAANAYDRAFEDATVSGLGYFRLSTDYVSPTSFKQEVRIDCVDSVFSVLMDPKAMDPLMRTAEYGFIHDSMSRDAFEASYPDSEICSEGFFEMDGDYEGWVTKDSVRIAEYFYVDFVPTELYLLSDGTSKTKDEYEKALKAVHGALGTTPGQTPLTLDDENEQDPNTGADGSKTLDPQDQSMGQQGQMGDDQQGGPVQGMDPNQDQQVPVSQPAQASDYMADVVDKRDIVQKIIRWCKITGYDVLEETVWAGTTIPIIPVIGDSYIIKGKRHFEGVVRQAKDPQRMYNYWASAETEMIALAPRAPFIGAAGTFENYEEQWRQANVRSVPYLEYNVMTSDGQQAPAPTRNQYEPPVMAITNARAQSVEDLKATTGIYDPSLGISSKEESGVAVLARQSQSSVTNFHYVDNLAKSVKLCGQIVLEVLKSVWDVPHNVQMAGDNPKTYSVGANNKHDPENGSVKLGVGDFEVVVEAGKSSTTQRQQSVEVLTTLSQANPAIATACADIIVKTLDIPEAREMAARLQKMLPPELQEGSLPPAAIAQVNQIKQQAMEQLQNANGMMGQMQQMIAELTAALNDSKNSETNKRMELASKERIEMAKIQATLMVQGSKVESAQNKAILDSEVNRLQTYEDRLHATQQNLEAQQDSDTYVIPGVNDPVTILRQQKQEDQMRQQAADQSGKVFNNSELGQAPSNLETPGPHQLGQRIVDQQQSADPSQQ